MKNQYVVTIALLLASSLSSADDRSNVYFGGALASTKYDDDGFYQQSRLDDSEIGGKLYGGYRFSDYISAELALTSLGTYEVESPRSDVETDFGAFTVSALGQLPIGAGFALYAQAGLGFASIDQDIAYATSDGFLVTDDDDDTGVVIVYGLGFNFIPPGWSRVQFRLGWERYVFSLDTINVDTDGQYKDEVDSEIELIHLGAAYRF